jgi:hypothetical protein
VTSPSPEKLGRSSKSRTKSPCSPHAVGVTDVDAEVLVDVEVVLTDSEPLSDALTVWEPEVELEDEIGSWLFVKVALLVFEAVGTVTVSEVGNELIGTCPSAKVVPLEESVCKTSVTELEFEVTVAGPFASELPMEDNACVLGVAELMLALEALAEVLVMSATPTELAVGTSDIDEASVLDAGETVPEPTYGVASPWIAAEVELPIVMVETSCGESVEFLAEDVSVGVAGGSTALVVPPVDDNEFSKVADAITPVELMLVGTADVVSAGTPVTP